jgi:hypothetical protein
MTAPKSADLNENKLATFLIRRIPKLHSFHDGLCRFIVAIGGDPIRRPRYCGAPILPGSAYCRRHHRLCLVKPGSPEGHRAVRRFEREAALASNLPPEFAYLSSVAVPELEAADEPRDIAGCIDVVVANDRDDE